MGRPSNGIRFLLIDFTSGMRLKERLPQEGRKDEGYDSTAAHISAIAGLRKPRSIRRRLLKHKSGFTCSDSRSVSSSLVPQVPRASSNSPTFVHVSGSLWKFNSEILLLLRYVCGMEC